MDDVTASRTFGLLSIGLGAAEVVAPERIGRFLGLENKATLLRLFGFREIAAGVGLLSRSRSAPWMWARVAGDALDLALVATALTPGRPRRATAATVLATLAAITAMDALIARRMQAENT
jgi:hypothetical protein